MLHLQGCRRACDDRLGSDGSGAGSEKALEDRQHGCPGDEVGTGTPTVSPGSAAEGWEQLCLLCPFFPCDVLFTLMNTRSACTGKDLSRASSPAMAWQSRARCSLQLQRHSQRRDKQVFLTPQAAAQRVLPCLELGSPDWASLPEGQLGFARSCGLDAGIPGRSSCQEHRQDPSRPGMFSPQTRAPGSRAGQAGAHPGRPSPDPDARGGPRSTGTAWQGRAQRRQDAPRACLVPGA